MTEFNPMENQAVKTTAKKLEPGVTAIAKIKMKNSKGEIQENTLYFGNAIYLNNNCFAVKNELYRGKITAFLKSEAGSQYVTPTDEEISAAFHEARSKAKVAIHFDYVAEKKEEQKHEVSANALKDIIKNSTYTAQQEREKKEADAEKVGNTGSSFDLNSILGIQPKKESEKINEEEQIRQAQENIIKQTKENLKSEHERMVASAEARREAELAKQEQERIAKEQAEKLAQEKLAHEQLSKKVNDLAKENERLAGVEAENTRMAEEIEAQKKINTEQQAQLQDKDTKLKESMEALEQAKALYAEEHRKFTEEKEKNDSLAKATQDLEQAKKVLLNQKQENDDEAAKLADEKTKFQSALDQLKKDRDLLQSKNTEIQTEYTNLDKAKQNLEESIKAAEAERDACKQEAEQAKAEVQELQEQMKNEREQLDKEKEELEEEKQNHKKDLIKEEREEHAKKNYTGKISAAVGITTASVIAAGFMGLCLFGVIPGLNPMAGKGSSELAVIKLKKDVAEGSVITDEDLEKVIISSKDYEKLSDGKTIKADGTTADNKAVLWSDANNVIGTYANANIGKGAYLMTSEYSDLKDGDSYVTMNIDGVETKVPVNVTTAGTSKVNLYAIVTSTDADGNTKNTAVDLGALSLEGRSLVDAVNSEGSSVIEALTGEQPANETN